ncbi:MAG: A/G-specific adenine glycosylase [Oligoflexia bacterium]|nr:A/G-specific adenine glycosylase [Oligoflexia bacterium]
MNLKAIHKDLLKWYLSHKRELPWRISQDPYRVWISEIMLQQTRVEAVIPYYERFLSHFPTVKDLANAQEDQVTNLWVGLGYYSRARNLHSCAKEVMDRFQGKFPNTKDELLSLPGIGPYTASAIASICFEQKIGAIDGNLERVIARLLSLTVNPKKEGKEIIQDFANNLVSIGEPGSINQAFMDLSSAICKPKNPNCNDCPIQKYCLGFQKNIQQTIPIKEIKKEKVEIQAYGFILVRNQKILLAKRAKKEWLAGMWDIPWNISLESQKEISKIVKEKKSCTVNRTITHHKIAFSVYALPSAQNLEEKIIKKVSSPVECYRWFRLQELEGIHLPKPTEKALGQLWKHLEDTK